jgi:hypothetical protein
VVGLMIALVIAVVAVGAVLAADRHGETGNPLRPSASPNTSDSPSPQSQQPNEVINSFQQQKPVVGERLSLLVPSLHKRYECRMNSYKVGTKTRGAFLDDCSFLTSQGYKDIFFFVVLKNVTNRPVSYDLRNFALTSHDGTTYNAVNITSSIRDLNVAGFIHETGKLVPHSAAKGWLTFDARTGSGPPVGRRLSYIDRGQTLTIIFKGRHEVEQ